MLTIRKRDIDWSKQFLDSPIHTLFGYVLKRNLCFGISDPVIELAEVYAVYRQFYSKSEIEHVWKQRITIV